MTVIKKKIIITSIVMLVTVASFVFSTIAYFTDSDAMNYSTISVGKATAEIVDVTYPFGSNIPVDPDAAIRILPGYEISKTVTARNTGNLPLWIRIRLDSDISLAENARGREAEIDNSLVGYDINTADWVFHEGYYYYRVALVHGKEATPLFTKVIFSEEMGNLYKDSTITFDVRIEIVQANNNGASAIEAEGWSAPSEEGGNA